MKKKILNILLVGIIIIGITGCGDVEKSNSTNNSENDKYILGETFTFDGLELTLDTNYSFMTSQNSASEYYGKSFIKLGVNVKNVSAEKGSLNSNCFSFVGPQGQDLEEIFTFDSEILDIAVEYGEDLELGASYKKYFIIPYDGDGNYTIKFNNFIGEKLSIEFAISK